MEPLPETSDAIDEMEVFGVEGDLLGYLQRSADLVRTLVPSCVGLTLMSLEDGLAFTLVATEEELAALDGVQLADDGPCLEGMREGERVGFEADDPTDEDRWRLFAAATAARGIASTLTLPIVTDGEVSGSINLYAAAPHAFEGHHDTLAGIFGARAEAAVRNADLGFTTRTAAERTAQHLRDEITVSRAAGLLVAMRGLTPEQAVATIEDAARRAGVQPVEIAQLILASQRTDPREDAD